MGEYVNKNDLLKMTSRNSYKTKKITTWSVMLCLLLGLLWSKDAVPDIFLMGDSISIHYGPYLIKDLAGVAAIDQKKIETLQGRTFSRNGGDSKRVLAYLTAKLSEPHFHPDYIILNCGLHDIGRDTVTKQLQVSPDEYKINLRKIFSMIQEKKIRIMWVTTTPVVDSIHNGRTKALLRYSADLENYNRIAAGVCKEFSVKKIDLHDFTQTLGTDAYIDNVHYKEEIRALQAAYIAGSVRMILNENGPLKK